MNTLLYIALCTHFIWGFYVAYTTLHGLDNTLAATDTVEFTADDKNFFLRFKILTVVLSMLAWEVCFIIHAIANKKAKTIAE